MIQIKLNNQIYSCDNIDKTIEVYKDYADIIEKDAFGYTILLFYNCRYDERYTIKEFENYLIGLENSK